MPLESRYDQMRCTNDDSEEAWKAGKSAGCERYALEVSATRLAVKGLQSENLGLREERNAAIRMAWELVQELAQKCNDPIHKKQLEELRKLHADYCLSNVKTVATEGAAMRSDEAAQPSSQD